jgi:hypothetical protein
MTRAEPESGETATSRGILAEPPEELLPAETATDLVSAGQGPAPSRDPNPRYRLTQAAFPTKTEIGPLVDLCVELRGDVPRSVAQSLVVEALDLCADLVLCEAWAVARQHLFPEAIRSAHSRHVGSSYAQRRAAELADILVEVV